MSGLLFFGFVLSSLGFFADVVFVFVCFFLLRDKAQVITGHTLTRTCFACSFLCPAAFVCFAHFGRASRFGVPFWAPCLFGILLVLALRPLFLGTQGGKGFPGFVLSLFFFPFCFAATRSLEARVGDLAEVG